MRPPCAVCGQVLRPRALRRERAQAPTVRNAQTDRACSARASTRGRSRCVVRRARAPRGGPPRAVREAFGRRTERPRHASGRSPPLPSHASHALARRSSPLRPRAALEA
eukprot:1480214-Prymnesium_polylepis.1